MEKRINFNLVKWDESELQKVITFWGQRKFHFRQVNDHYLVGKRGSLIGNLTAFDMRRLETEITITINENIIDVVLNISIIFQYISQSNHQYFDLELETFKSFLLDNDLRVEEWEHHKKEARISNVLFTLLFSGFGVIIGLIIFIPMFYLIGRRF